MAKKSAIYYCIRRNKYRGDMVIIFEPSKVFNESIRILNKGKQHDTDKKGLEEVMRGETFLGPEMVTYNKEENPLLFFKFGLSRELSQVEEMKSDLSLKELQDLADNFDNEFKDRKK